MALRKGLGDKLTRDGHRGFPEEASSVLLGLLSIQDVQIARLPQVASAQRETTPSVHTIFPCTTCAPSGN
ncbi:hypothetical protein HUU59_03530 [bacterium]|nr:hypothetical protein [bacterium]